MSGKLSFSVKGLFSGHFLVILFFLFTAGLAFGHGSSVLDYAYPLFATFLGFFLFLTKRHIYLSFTWLTWLFTPLVRRLVDYHTGFHQVSPVMFAPLLVTLISIIPLLRSPRIIFQRQLSDFLLIFIVFLYALAIGLVSNPIPATVYEFLGFFVPFAFGMTFMADSSGFLKNRATFLSTAMVGLLLISAYGIYQFRAFPPWDAYWLQQSGFASAGLGIADQVRLFGPLNSPGGYGFVLMGSLIFALVVKGPMKILAAGVGFPAFGLSLVRSGWVGFVVAAVFLALTMGGKARVRLAVVGFAAILLAYPLITVGPIAAQLQSRFSSFNNIQQDGSYLARQKIYQNDTVIAFTQPIGVGFGGLAPKSDTAASSAGQLTGIDSGVLEFPMYFGWVFGSIFFIALGRISVRVLGAGIRSPDPVNKAGAALFIVLVLENAGGQTFGGGIGFMIWMSAGMALGPIVATSPRRVLLAREIPTIGRMGNEGEASGLPVS